MPALLRSLAVALLLALPAAAQALGTRALEEARARDARVSFSAESARRARAVLENPPLVALERSLAALAVGTARSSADLARLELLASEGPEGERRAALYALGELGAVGLQALERRERREPGMLADALVAALRVAEQRGATEAPALLETLARKDDTTAIWAHAALAVRAGEAPGALGAALQLHYELRWRAAQTYGFVDGERWNKVRLRELARLPEFNARVIFGASEALFTPALKAHLIETLAKGEPPGALELGVRVLGRELGAALKGGEWQPAGPESWARILVELERTRGERGARELVEYAYLKVPELETEAGTLLLRAGGDLPWKWIADRLASGTPEERAALFFAVGERGQRELVSDLAALLESRPELGFGPGLVALVRLGHEPALEAASDLVEGLASARRDELVRALLPALHDKRVKKLALEAYERTDQEPGLAVDLAIALAAAGERAARVRLRAELPEAPPGARRLAAVRALSVAAEPADIDALARLFPLEDEFDTNIALALALLRARHPSSRPVLQAALWQGEWTVSLLAGGLVVAAAGAAGLSDELDSAPADVDEGDLRRVGFALGEWGGQPALDELLRRRPESDPAVQGALLGLLSARSLAPTK
ncbi:MAG: hypothetical protein ABL998_22220, partial [Planctomycetota bacterium]